MDSNAETTVAMAPLEIACEETRVDEMGGRNNSTENGGVANEGWSPQASIATTDGDSQERDREEYRRGLVSCSANQRKPPSRLDVFMAEADSYPRFVWQDFLLSFHSFQTMSRECDDMDTVRRHGLEKLSYIIDAYPDILQREVLRDSFQSEMDFRKRRSEMAERRTRLTADQMEATGSKDKFPTETAIRERYGVLHAAVLLGRKELVQMVRDPDTYREKIRTILTPTKGANASSSFGLIRRAILWRNMHKMNAHYATVVSLMKNLKNAINTAETEALRTLIDKTAEQLPEPWVIILAWSSVTPGCRHILDEFKTKQPKLLKNILRRYGSQFTHFFTGAPKHKDRTVAELMKILVPTSCDGKDVRQTSDQIQMARLFLDRLSESTPTPTPDQMKMSQLFLDRLSEPTPTSRWSPLHLAAAKGDHDMVKILTKSCDTALGRLGDQTTKNSYTRLLEESFFDAKDMTPLHYAVLGNHNRVVEYLIGWALFQPFVNERDIFKRTAFQMACSLQERATIVEHFVGNPKIEVNTKDCCSFTSLHWAVYSESSDAVKFLLFQGKKKMIRTTEKDNEGRHAFELAARLQTPSQKEIEQLLLSSPAVKEEVERLYRDRQVYVDASNAILVGAALIASVTFGGWLQPPLGNHQGSTDQKVRIFWAFSSLSFFFAIATVMAGAAAVLPVRDEYIKDSVDNIRRWLAVTALLLILSVTCVLGAFAAAGFVSLSLVPDLTGNMTITTIVGSVVCATIGLFFCYRLFRVRPDWKHMFKTKRELYPKNKESEKNFLQQILGEFSIRTKDPSTSDNEGSSIEYGPENCSIWDPVSESLPIISDPSRMTEFFEAMHRQEGSSRRCLVRECYPQLESFCLREVLNCNGIQTEASLQKYIDMWNDLNEAPLFKAVILTDKMRKVVQEMVETQMSLNRDVQGEDR